MADFDTPQSTQEALLQNILGASNAVGVPQSRIEKIWQYALGADGVVIEPAQSRIEALAIQVAEQVRSGGGGGGGITPTGSTTLTDNGTYDVTTYAQAIVNVEKGYTQEEVDEMIDEAILDYQTNTEPQHIAAAEQAAVTAYEGTIENGTY